jgi:hypothetical protein
MIVDGDGELVWFHPIVHKAVTDFKVASYRGKPVLTWWEGRVVEGLAVGEWVVLDSSYRELARFPAAKGRHGDLHEFVVTPDDTALVTSNETVTWDLRSVGGSERGKVVGESSRSSRCRAAVSSGSGAASSTSPSTRRR